FDDSRTVTRDRTIDDATQDAALIRRVAAECVKRVALTRRIRLFGVRVGGLLRADALAPVAREPEPSTANLFDQRRRLRARDVRVASSARISSSSQARNSASFGEPAMRGG